MAVALTRQIQFTFLTSLQTYTAFVPDHIVDSPEFESTVTVNGMVMSVHAALATEVTPEASGQSFQDTRTAWGGEKVATYVQIGTRDPDPMAAAEDLPITLPHVLPFIDTNYPNELLADVLTPEETFAYWPATGPYTVWSHVPWALGGGPDLDALLAGLLVKRANDLNPIIYTGAPISGGDISDRTQQDTTTYYSSAPDGTPPTGVSGDPSVGTPMSVTFAYAGGFGADSDDIDGDSAVVTRASGSLTVSCDGPLSELATLQQVASGIMSSAAPGAGR